MFPWLEVESFAVLHQTGGAFEGSNSLALEKDLPFPNLAPVQLPSLAQEIEVLWVGNPFAFLLDPPRMYLVHKTPENGRTLASVQSRGCYSFRLSPWKISQTYVYCCFAANMGPQKVLLFIVLVLRT